MQMEPGLDTGPIIEVARVAIEPNDSTESLTRKLADAGGAMAPDAIARWVAGETIARPQPDDGASFVRPLVKADGWIDWRLPAVQIERLVRGMDPWPRAWTTTASGITLQVFDSAVVEENYADPGTVMVAGRDVVVACGEGTIRLGSVQLAGSKKSDPYELIQGRKLKSGDHLGQPNAAEQAPSLITRL
jgi:methionyl-tRNA formyltransferase